METDIDLEVEHDDCVGYTYYFRGRVVFQHPYDNEAARSMAFDNAKRILDEASNKQNPKKV